MLAKKTTPHIKMSLSQKGNWGQRDCGFSLFSSIQNHTSAGLRSGQVVLEYVLLLVISILIGGIIMHTLVGTRDSPQGIRSSWKSLITKIGQDIPDSER